MVLSTVYIDQAELDALEIAAHPAKYNERLANAKILHGYAICGCNDAELRLVIRKVAELNRLSLWPNEGAKHAQGCIFHRDEIHERVRIAFSRQSIVESDDGLVTITPDFDLKLKLSTKARPTGAKPKQAAAQSVTRRKAGLTALLQFLWDWSRLNSRTKTSPNFSQTTYRLWLAMGVCKFGQVDMTSVTYLPGMEGQERDWYSKFEGRLQKSNTDQLNYGVVIGKLVSVAQTQFGYRYTVKSLGRALYVDEALQSKLEASFPQAFQAVAQQSALNVFLAAQVEITSRGNLKVRDCGFIVTSRDFIPVDSMYEAQFCDKLVDEDRAFNKPLKVEDGLLPDFVLLDTPTPTFVEVWGMNTDDYKLRRAEKVKAYANLNHVLLEWDAANGDSMPQLPAKGTQK